MIWPSGDRTHRATTQAADHWVLYRDERERENVSDARTNYTWFWVTFRCLLKFSCSARLRFHEVSMLYACVCSARRELTSIPYIGLLVVLFMNFDICLIHFNWNWMLDLDMPMPCLPLLPWCDVAILFSFLMPSICSALRMALALYLRWNCYVFNGNIFWRYINIHTANVVMLLRNRANVIRWLSEQKQQN